MRARMPLEVPAAYRSIMDAPSQFEFPDGMLAQPELLHLAARRHADGLEVLHDPEVARHAEVGAARLRPGDQVGLGSLEPRPERHVRAGHLAQPGTRHAADRRALARGMREEH